MAIYVRGSGFKIIGRFANLSTGIDENGRSTQSPSEDHIKPYTELIFEIYLCIRCNCINKVCQEKKIHIIWSDYGNNQMQSDQRAYLWLLLSFLTMLFRHSICYSYISLLLYTYTVVWRKHCCTRALIV